MNMMTRGNVRYRFCGGRYTLALVRWLTDEEALARFDDERTTRLANSTLKQCAVVRLERETFGPDGRTLTRVELARREL